VIQRRKRLRRVSKKRAALNAKRREFVREQLEKRPWCEAGRRIGLQLEMAKQMTESAFRDVDYDHSMELVNPPPPIKKVQLWTQCGRSATELHEPMTRARDPRAETILDPDNSVAICRPCHDWIHAHPAEAEKLGLLKSSRGL
jgi:hypothetical protein